MIGIVNNAPNEAALMAAAQLQLPVSGQAMTASGAPVVTVPGATIQPLDLTKEQPPNSYNDEIAQEEWLYRHAIRSTAGRWNNGTPGSTTYKVDGPGGSGASFSPWLHMPLNGRPFHYQTAVNCPAPGSNDFSVLSFIVPPGWSAAIWGVSNLYTGAGFDQGSGDLIWRISVDGAFSPGFDSIQTTLGGINESRQLQGPIIAEGGQLVNYSVSVSAGAPFPTGLAAKIVCAFDGWIYPSL